MTQVRTIRPPEIVLTEYGEWRDGRFWRVKTLADEPRDHVLYALEVMDKQARMEARKRGRIILGRSRR